MILNPFYIQHNPLLVQCHASHLTSPHSTKCNQYFANPLAPILTDNTLQRPLAIKFTNFMSTFNCTDRPKQFIRGPVWHFIHEITRQNPNPAWPPLVGCPPLLIRYIRSYPSHLMDSLLHKKPDSQPCVCDTCLLNMRQYTRRIWILDMTQALRLTVTSHTVVKGGLTKYTENVWNSRANSRYSRVTRAQIVMTSVTDPTTFSANQWYQHARV
jgi:hypothetical protein